MRRSLLPLALVGLLGLTALPGTASAAHEGLVVTGLAANGKLVTFVADTGERLGQTKKVSGVADGFALVSIDYSPRAGQLFGVATSGTQGQIYEIDPTTAVAQARGLVFDIAGDVSVDVNPVPNALRVVSSDGTNLRFPLATFAKVTDVPLTRPGVVGVAYTNNDNDTGTAGATGTQLFYVDAPTDTTSTTADPNAGVLTPVGPTGTDLGSDTGFDVYSEVEGGRAVSNVALLSDRDEDGTRVYTLRLGDGGVNPPSAVLVQGAPVVDIAVDPRQ